MDQDRRSNDSARCFQSHAIPVHEKHLRSSRGPETRFAAKMFPLERFIATPVLLPLTFVEEASSVRRAMLSVRRAIFCRAHRGNPIELVSDRIPGVGDERLSSRYPSGVEHRDPRAGIPSAGIPWNQRVWQFDSPSTNTTLLLRFGEEVKSVEARFGSRFHRKRSPSSPIRKRTASSSAPTPKYGNGIGMTGEVAATISRHLCCRISHNARRFV
jgi:hypothetical protein